MTFSIESYIKIFALILSKDNIYLLLSFTDNSRICGCQSPFLSLSYPGNKHFSQYITMTYIVQTLPDVASYFRDPNNLLFRYVVKDTSDLPVPVEILDKHKSVTILHDFEKYVDDIRDLKVYDDDIWIISYPKCGSTWAQEAVWQIMHDIDFDEGGKVPLNIRIGFLE